MRGPQGGQPLRARCIGNRDCLALLGIGGESPLTIRAGCVAIRHFPDPLGFVLAGVVDSPPSLRRSEATVGPKGMPVVQSVFL